MVFLLTWIVSAQEFAHEQTIPRQTRKSEILDVGWWRQPVGELADENDPEEIAISGKVDEVFARSSDLQAALLNTVAYWEGHGELPESTLRSYAVQIGGVVGTERELLKRLEALVSRNGCLSGQRLLDDVRARHVIDDNIWNLLQEELGARVARRLRRAS